MGSKPGTKRRWTADDELRLASDLAERNDDLQTIAARWSVPYSYLRRIACGERRPRIAHLAQQLRAEAFDAGRRGVAFAAPTAVKVLVELMDNPKVRAEPRRRAAVDLLRIAFADVSPAAETTAQPERNVVTLTDLLREANLTGLDDPRLGRLETWEERDDAGTPSG